MAAALLVAIPTQSAAATQPASTQPASTPGASTPGAIVTAVNPAAAMRAGSLHIALAAHAEKNDVDNPSCQPQGATLRCWGSLVLRLPDAGGLSVSAFEVHRVAVADVTCGDEGDDGCGGHESVSRSTLDAPVQAVVTGLADVREPGSTDVDRGSRVQLKIHLVDNIETSEADLVDVQVNEFVPGPVKPELYRSGPQAIQQVRIHLAN